GRLIWAISNSPKDDLEKVITAHNLVAPKNVERVKKMVETPDALGKALIEKGLISLEELIDCSREQIKRIVVGVLKWRRGDYRFVSETPPERLLTLDLNVTDITGEFILKNLAIGYVRENIGALQSIYKKNPDNQKIEKYNLSEVQEQILRAFDGTQTLEAILSQYSGANKESVLKIIYYFLMADILSAGEAGAGEVPVPVEAAAGDSPGSGQPAYDPAMHNEMPDLNVDDIEYAFERQVDLGMKEKEAAPPQEEKPVEPEPAFQHEMPAPAGEAEPASQPEMPAPAGEAEPGYEPGMPLEAGVDDIAESLDGAFMEEEEGEGAEQIAPNLEQAAPAAEGPVEPVEPAVGPGYGNIEAAAGEAEAANYDYQDMGIERGEAAIINLEQNGVAQAGMEADAGAEAGDNLEFEKPLEVERGETEGSGEAGGIEPDIGDMGKERGEAGADYDYDHIEAGGEAPQAAAYDEGMVIERGETGVDSEQEEIAPAGEAVEIADDYGTGNVGAETAGAVGTANEQDQVGAEAGAAAAPKKKPAGKLKQLADGTYTFVQEGEEEETVMGVTEKLPDNEAYTVGAEIPPPGEFAAGGDIAPPGEFAGGGDVAPPGEFSAGGDVAPPGKFAAGGDIAPPGEFAADGNNAPPGKFSMSGGPPSTGPVLADDEELLPPKKYPAGKVLEDRKPTKPRRKPSKSRKKPVKRKAAAEKKGSRPVYLVFIALAAILVISGAIFLYLNYLQTDDEPVLIPVKDKQAKVQKDGRTEIDMTKAGQTGKQQTKPTPKPTGVSPQPPGQLHQRFEVKSNELKNKLRQPAIRNFFTEKLGDPQAVKFFKQGKFIEAGNNWKKELKKSGVRFSILLEMDCMKESVVNAFLKTEMKAEFFLLNRKLGKRNCFLVLWGKFYTKQEAADAVKMVPQYFWKQQHPPEVISLSRYLVN
ncbi:MAG: hypothetical protein KAW12_05870, partial [Candidatus Aminicenantes bacterium]|nr:hypothetical protein [Candidatus Aminicenantes bacterium]